MNEGAVPRLLVSQYVYFELYSVRTTAVEMAAWLGLEPDAASVRGSRREEPAIPASHCWRAECREAGMRVGEQFTRLLARLDSHTARIAGLAARLRAEDAESPGGAVLQVVRHFNDEEARADHPSDASQSGTRAADLLGWHLGRDVLNFIEATGAALDVDEYDFSE